MLQCTKWPYVLQDDIPESPINFVTISTPRFERLDELLEMSIDDCLRVIW